MKNINTVLLVVVALFLGAILTGGGIYLYSQNKKNVVYTVDVKSLIELENKRIERKILAGDIKNAKVAKRLISAYTNDIKSAIFELSRELNKPIFDKRAVISINQKDITSDILKVLK